VMSIEHHAATERRGDQNIEEALVVESETELQLTHGSGRGIVLHEDRNLQDSGKQLANGRVAPDGVFGRLAMKLRPLNVIGKCNSDSHHLVRVDPGLRQQMFYRPAEK